MKKGLLGNYFYPTRETRYDDIGNRVEVFSHRGMPKHLIPAALDNISITVAEFCRNGSCTLRCVNK